MSRVKNYLPLNVLKTLYFSFIYPHLTYGIVTWGAATSQCLQKLNILHNRAVRFMTKSKYNTPINHMYNLAYCLKISEIYKLSLIQFFFKWKNNLLRLNALQYFSVQNNYNLRNNIIHAYNRTTSRQKHAFIAGPILWSQLDSNIKNINSIVILKKRYKIFLLSQYD